jgi:copper ion binding protein
METVLKIKGMSCAHCVQHVKEALEALAGVKSTDVNLENKSAKVEHGDEVSLATLSAAVIEAGYDMEE